MQDVPTERPDRVQLLFITEPRMSDANFFTSWYTRTHQKTIAAIKAGTTPNPLSVPASQLPD